jgi:hypothetical protein
MNTPRTLFAAAVVTAALVVPGYASARPVPLDPPGGVSTSGYSATAGRTDQQFWGEATWLNPLSGLNLDRTSVAH